MASVGVMVLKVHTPAARVISEMPSPTEVMARRMGRLMATAAPSITSRITIATRIPMSSLRPVVGGSALAITGPPNSVWTPAALAACRAVSSSWVTESFGTSMAGCENWTVAYATRPFSLTWSESGAKGSLTLTTPGTASALATAASTPALASPVSRRPESTANTIWAESPERAGKRLSRRSTAFWESEPGRENSSMS